jgi:hypothetical protein
LRDPFRVGNEPVGAFFRFEAFVPILADDNAHEFQHVRWPKAGTPPSFELVFELLDVREERNAVLTSTVSKGGGLSGSMDVARAKYSSTAALPLSGDSVLSPRCVCTIPEPNSAEVESRVFTVLNP